MFGEFNAYNLFFAVSHESAIPCSPAEGTGVRVGLFLFLETLRTSQRFYQTKTKKRLNGQGTSKIMRDSSYSA
jgi:hypothetical protein